MLRDDVRGNKQGQVVMDLKNHYRRPGGDGELLRYCKPDNIMIVLESGAITLMWV